jgi:hypothetical protein
MCGTRESVKNWASNKDEFKSWRYDLPNSFYLASDKDEVYLSQSFRRHCGGKGRFIIIKIGLSRHGFLPKDTWEFIRKFTSDDEIEL